MITEAKGTYAIFFMEILITGFWSLCTDVGAYVTNEMMIFSMEMSQIPIYVLSYLNIFYLNYA
jgi:hypothetical protein